MMHVLIGSELFKSSVFILRNTVFMTIRRSDRSQKTKIALQIDDVNKIMKSVCKSSIVCEVNKTVLFFCIEHILNLKYTKQ